MNASKMADRVLAAFLSAFFSTAFFFFLSGLDFSGIIDLETPEVAVTACFEITFAFKGIRMSVTLEARLFTA